MTDVSSVLPEAFAAIGVDTERRIGELIAEFAALPLSDEDRLSALAGSIAAIAEHRYAGHGAFFIGAVRCWALEMSLARVSSGPPPIGRGHPRRIRAAQDLLLEGIGGILRRLAASNAPGRSRIVAEVGLLARLLGRYDAASIHVALTAAGARCDRPDIERGDAVVVSLHELAMPLSRSTDLAAVAPRGTA